MTYAPDSLVGRSPADLASAMQWMSWTNEHLEPQLHTLVMECVRLAPALRNTESLETARLATIAKLEVLDHQLGHQRYLAGDEFSMGDIPAGATVYRWSLFELASPQFANLQDWQKRLQDRVAFQDFIAPVQYHLT